MKKIYLLFLVFILKTNSSFSQCNKNFELLVNDRFNSKYNDFQGGKRESYNLCNGSELSFVIKNPEPNVTLRVFRNDTLVVNLESSGVKFSDSGVYRIQLGDSSCLYEMGKFNVTFSNIINVNLFNYSSTDIVSCNDVASGYLVADANEHSKNLPSFQWNLNGKELDFAKGQILYPNKPGIYTVSVTKGSCSGISSPMEIKDVTNYIINGKLSITGGFRNLILKNDTVTLCKNEKYTLKSAEKTNWYKDGLEVAKNEIQLTISQPGEYFTKRNFNDKCEYHEKVVVKFENELPPPILTSNYFTCNANSYLFEIPSYVENKSTIRFTSILGNENISQVYAPLYDIPVSFSTRSINIHTGSCSTKKLEIIPEKKLELEDWNGKKIGGKKIVVCTNGSFLVRLVTSAVYSYELYKNGVLYKKYDSEFYGNNVILTESGKYHFLIMRPSESCVIPSDTVEILSGNYSGKNIINKSNNCNKIELSLDNIPVEKFRWYFNDSLIMGEEKKSIIINNPKIGRYHAEIIDGNCISTSVPFYWGTKIIASKSTLCEGQKLELKATNPSLTYSWKNPKGETISLPSITKESTKKEDAGLYILSTNIGECVISDSINLQIKPKPNVELSLANPYCVNQNLIVKLVGNSGLYYFNYNFDEKGSPISSKYLSVYNSYQPIIFDLGKIVNPPVNKSVDLVKVTWQEEYNNPSSCIFEYIIPGSEQSKVDCNNILEFLSIKDKYCLKEFVSLSIKVPKDIKPSTKFNLSIITSYGYSTYLGKLQYDKIEFQIPQSGIELRYKIESEDKKFVAFSKDFQVDFLPEYLGYDFDRHCKGHFSTLNISDSPNNKFVWKKDGIIIPNESSSKLKVFDSGNYSVVTTSLDGCQIESKTVKIYDNEIPKPYIYSSISSNSSCEKSIIPLTIGSLNYPYKTYEWLLDNKTIQKTNHPKNFEAKESGSYKLKVTYDNCVVFSDSISLRFEKSVENYIRSRSNYGAFNTITSRLEKCSGSMVDIYTYFPSLDDYSDTAQYKRFGVSFQWFRNGNALKNENKPSLSTTEEGEYKLLRKQNECVSFSNHITVADVQRVQVNLNYDKFYYKNNSLNQIELCKDESLEIYGVGVYREFSDWANDLYKNDKIIETRLASNYYTYHNIKEEGKYFIKFSNPNNKNCLAVSDTINVKIKEESRVFPTDTIFLCEESKKISLDYEGDTYSWKFEGIEFSKEKETNITKTGLYTLDIKNSSSCITQRTFYITNKANLFLYDDNSAASYSKIELLPKKYEICQNQTLDLDVAYNSVDEIYIDTYDIYKNQVLYKKDQNNILINEPGEYYVKSNQKYCEGISNKINVVQNSAETSIFSPTVDSLFFCKNGYQTLELSTNSSNKLYWYHNNTLIENLNGSLTASKEGEYFALISDNNCVEKTKSKFLKEKNIFPTAIISGDTTIDNNTTALLKIKFTSSPPFQFTINDSIVGISEKTFFEKEIKPIKTETYQITSLSNTCGAGSFSGRANIQVIILGNEPSIGAKILLFPNPSSDYCHLSFELDEISTISVEILDTKGVKLETLQLGVSKKINEIINFQNLKPGVYFLKINIGNQTITRKVIKY